MARRSVRRPRTRPPGCAAEIDLAEAHASGPAGDGLRLRLRARRRRRRRRHGRARRRRRAPRRALRRGRNVLDVAKQGFAEVGLGARRFRRGGGAAEHRGQRVGNGRQVRVCPRRRGQLGVRPGRTRQEASLVHGRWQPRSPSGRWQPDPPGRSRQPDAAAHCREIDGAEAAAPRRSRQPDAAEDRRETGVAEDGGEARIVGAGGQPGLVTSGREVRGLRLRRWRALRDGRWRLAGGKVSGTCHCSRREVDVEAQPSTGGGGLRHRLDRGQVGSGPTGRSAGLRGGKADGGRGQVGGRRGEVDLVGRRGRRLGLRHRHVLPRHERRVHRGQRLDRRGETGRGDGREVVQLVDVAEPWRVG